MFQRVRKLKKFIHKAAAASAAAMLAAAIVPVAANADTGAAPDQGKEVVVGAMTFAGYDEDVAAAHGYKIVTNPDGTQSSVPVTKEAKLETLRSMSAEDVREKASAKGLVTPYDTVSGDCGISWLEGDKGANDRLSFETGYLVTGNVATRVWSVQANGFITSNSWNFNGGATGPEWVSTGAGPVVGPGTAFVPAFASYVVKTNGETCYSGGPSFGFW